MKILCISCSNIVHKKKESASTKVCTLVQEIAELQESIQTETIRLVDHQLENCIFCGECKESGLCIYDDAFNEIYQKMIESDRVVLVVPFYQVIPSKLAMVLEKINQLCYTAYLAAPEQPFVLAKKKIAVIGHGGTNLAEVPQMEGTYRDLLLKPLNFSLRSLTFDVVGLEEEGVKGVVFGVEGYQNIEGATFPDMVHDWSAVREKIVPLVHRLIA